MRTILVSLAVVAALAFAACGSAKDSDAPSAASAKASIEQAAGLRLVAEKVPAEARDEGLEASFTNAATTAKDRQMVALFLLKDESVTGKVKEMVKGTVPAGSRLMSNGKVLVLYAAAGSDHRAEVEKAVDAM